MRRSKKGIVRKKAMKKAMWGMSSSQYPRVLEHTHPVTDHHMLPFVSTLSKNNARAGRVLKSMFRMGLAEAAKGAKRG